MQIATSLHITSTLDCKSKSSVQIERRVVVAYCNPQVSNGVVMSGTVYPALAAAA